MSLSLFATSAANPKSYSATGSLTQEDPGQSVVTVSENLPGGFPDGVVGRLTTNQSFSGELASSDWESLTGAQVIAEPHNSFVSFTDGFPDFASGVEEIAGVAFGDIRLRRDVDDWLVGTYVADIVGTIVIDLSCGIDSALGVPARVEVIDVGTWTAVMWSGEYRAAGRQGDQ